MLGGSNKRKGKQGTEGGEGGKLYKSSMTIGIRRGTTHALTTGLKPRSDEIRKAS